MTVKRKLWMTRAKKHFLCPLLGHLPFLSSPPLHSAHHTVVCTVAFAILLIASISIGHEFSVLSGATELLRQKPPIIIVEFNPVMMEWSAGHDAYEVLLLLHKLGYILYDGQISEPAKKGFLSKYGSLNRPNDFRELVDWFKKSKEFDWWGSWTDILAILPP